MPELKISTYTKLIGPNKVANTPSVTDNSILIYSLKNKTVHELLDISKNDIRIAEKILKTPELLSILGKYDSAKLYRLTLDKNNAHELNLHSGEYLLEFAQAHEEIKNKFINDENLLKLLNPLNIKLLKNPLPDSNSLYFSNRTAETFQTYTYGEGDIKKSGHKYSSEELEKLDPAALLEKSKKHTSVAKTILNNKKLLKKFGQYNPKKLAELTPEDIDKRNFYSGKYLLEFAQARKGIKNEFIKNENLLKLLGPENIKLLKDSSPDSNSSDFTNANNDKSEIPQVYTYGEEDTVQPEDKYSLENLEKLHPDILIQESEKHTRVARKVLNKPELLSKLGGYNKEKLKSLTLADDINEWDTSNGAYLLAFSLSNVKIGSKILNNNDTELSEQQTTELTDFVNK